MKRRGTKAPEGRLARKRRAERYGRSAELLCVLALRLRGYRILVRRFRSPQGEIDIVAQDGEELGVVEVRTRRGDRFGSPEESVTLAKLERLALGRNLVGESGVVSLRGALEERTGAPLQELSVEGVLCLSILKKETRYLPLIIEANLP